MVVRKIYVISILLFFISSFSLFADVKEKTDLYKQEDILIIEDKDNTSEDLYNLSKTNNEELGNMGGNVSYYSQDEINEMIDRKYSASYNSITFWSWAVGIIFVSIGLYFLQNAKKRIEELGNKLEESINSANDAAKIFEKNKENYNKLEKMVQIQVKDLIDYNLARFNFSDINKEKAGDAQMFNSINNVEKHSSLSSIQLFAKSVLLIRKSEYNKAIYNLKKSLSIKDSYYSAMKKEDVYYKLGFCYSQISRNKEAIEFYSRAISININHFASYINRGRLYLKEDAFKQASKDFLKAIEIKEKDPAGWCNLLNLHLKTKNYEIVERIFEEIDKLEIEEIDIEYNRICYYSLIRNFEKAKELYIFFIQKNPSKGKSLALDPDLIGLFNTFPDLER